MESTISKSGPVEIQSKKNCEHFHFLILVVVEKQKRTIWIFFGSIWGVAQHNTYFITKIFQLGMNILFKLWPVFLGIMISILKLRTKQRNKIHVISAGTIYITTRMNIFKNYWIWHQETRRHPGKRGNWLMKSQSHDSTLWVHERFCFNVYAHSASYFAMHSCFFCFQ